MADWIKEGIGYYVPPELKDFGKKAYDFASFIRPFQTLPNIRDLFRKDKSIAENIGKFSSNMAITSAELFPPTLLASKLGTIPAKTVSKSANVFNKNQQKLIQNWSKKENRVELINSIFSDPNLIKDPNLINKLAKELNDQGLHLGGKDSLKNAKTAIGKIIANKKGLKSEAVNNYKTIAAEVTKKSMAQLHKQIYTKEYLSYVNKLEELKKYDPQLPHYDPATAKKMFYEAHKKLFPTKKSSRVAFKSNRPSGGWGAWKNILKEKRPDLYEYFKPIAEPPKPKNIDAIVKSGKVQTDQMKVFTGQVKNKQGELVDKPGTALMRKLFKNKIPEKAGGSKAHALQKEWRKHLVEKYGDEVIDPNTGQLIPELKNYSFITTAKRNEKIHKLIENDLMKQLTKRENYINAFKKGDMTLKEFKPLINVTMNRINKINKRMTNLGLETKTFDPFKKTGAVVSYGAPSVSLSRLYSHPRFGFKKLGYNEGGIASIFNLIHPL